MFYLQGDLNNRGEASAKLLAGYEVNDGDAGEGHMIELPTAIDQQ